MECPYCFEEIKDGALKCKHCNEWLNKPNTINLDNIKSGVLSGAQAVGSILGSFKDALLGPSKYTMPTDEEPYEIEKLKLFETYFTFDNQVYNYDDIVSLYYNLQSTTINFANQTRVDVKIFPKVKNGRNYPLEDRVKNTYIHLHTFATILIPVFFGHVKKTKIAFLILSEKTFHTRMGFYMKQLIDKDYFDYPKGIRFYFDGTIVKGSKKVDLIKAFKNDAILEGDKRGFLLNSYSNSFKIEFANEHKLFGSYISTNLYYDADVMRYLLNTFKEHHGFITDKNMWNGLSADFE